MRKLLPIIFLLTAALQACARAEQRAPLAAATASTDPATSPTSSPAFDSAKRGTSDLDITYCTPDGVELKMDIHYPESGDGPWPVAMYVHGGGWVSGDKSKGVGARDLPALTQAGFLTVAINYRLAPEYKFPAQIEDVKCAVRFLRAHAAEYNLDPERIGAWGGSAGGHLVSLLGTADESAGWDVGEYLDQSSRVQAVVDMFGPSDLTAGDFIIMRRERKADILFGVADLTDPVVAQASPINHVSADDPPFLILHGAKDDLVPPNQSQTFYKALLTAGVPAQLVMVENAGHGFAPVEGAINPARGEITQMIVRFFQQTLSLQETD